MTLEDAVYLVTDGHEYVTLLGHNDEYASSFSSIVTRLGGTPKFLTAAGDTRACQLFGIVAVPTVVLVKGGEVSSLVGIHNEYQLETFLKTGVSPV